MPYPQRVAEKLDIKAVHSESGDQNELVFDLVGVDASIANALRRILLAEVSAVDACNALCFYSGWRNVGLAAPGGRAFKDPAEIRYSPEIACWSPGDLSYAA